MSDTDQDDHAELTLADLCKSCGLSTAQITAYVQEGLFEVSGDDARHWRFSETHLVIFQKVVRLEQDLRLNPAGAVLVFELMNEIDVLKRQLRHFGAENI
jgi:chaperone modulatory protein CbpM